MPAATPSATDVLLRQLRVLLPAVALLALAFFVPVLNPPDGPSIDLQGPLAVAAYGVAASGHVGGITALGLILTAVLVSRPGITPRRRVTEAAVVVLTVAVLQGGGALLNEYVVKPALRVPRPNIRELARTPPNAPVLGMSAERFYAEYPDKESRRKYLAQVLPADHPMHDLVRRHWLEETGYSFPSNHSFSALMFASFFLAMGLSALSGPRLWVFYLLVPWALAVCLSRPILRVHTPADVLVGALEGLGAGTLAFVLARKLLEASGSDLPRTPL